MCNKLATASRVLVLQAVLFVVNQMCNFVRYSLVKVFRQIVYKQTFVEVYSPFVKM